MPKLGVSTATVLLKEALGSPWFELGENGRSLIGSHGQPSTIDLLDLPAELARNGIGALDICIQHLPSIDAGYLAELRAALAAADVELYQLLIDLGNVSSPDPAEREASINLTKRWIAIAAELGATGVRYVPGDSTPTPETIRLSSEAFRKLADYANQHGVQPATENYKAMTHNPDNLLQIITQSERGYGLVADFGNASGSNKYEILAKLLPQATSIHAWAVCDENGRINTKEFHHCLTKAQTHGFDDPIMLLGALPTHAYKQTHTMWSGINALKQQVYAVFGEDELT